MEKNLITAVRTADVIGKEIIGNDDNKLGKIEELVISKEKGNVRYIVLSHGGFLGLGSDFYTIPWGCVSYCSERQAFYVEFNKDVLSNAPGFNKDSWPDFANTIWSKPTDDFYNHYVTSHSKTACEQRDFLNEGGNSQPLNRP
ncbi:MAG: PRC-barrel domain-containing protein [Burkholderiales bacterium]|nr:PRC-barrel domain-containing protein [Burkholderiales bacterium]